MSNVYKMLAGLMIFVTFFVSFTVMASLYFPDLAIRGVDPNAIPRALEPKPPTINVSACNDFFSQVACAVGTIVNPIVSFFQMASGLASGFFAMLAGVFTFDIPAFAGNPYLQVLRIALIVAIIVPMSLLLFLIIKSVIPTVGGEVAG